MAGIALLVCSLVGLAACEGRVGPLAEGMPASGPPVEELPPEGSPPTSGKGEIRIVSFACAPAEGVVPHAVTCAWEVEGSTGDPLTCALDLQSDGQVEASGGCEAFRSWGSSLLEPGAVTARLVASDGTGNEASAEVELRTAPNQPPAIATFTATPVTAPAPHAVRFAWALTDPEDDALVCTLDDGPGGDIDQMFDPCPAGGEAQVTFDSVGTRDVRFTVSDPWGNREERVARLSTTQPPTVDLTVSRVEWGQTVMKEDLRLVAGKPALLRAYVISNESGVADVAVRATGRVNGAVMGTLTLQGPSMVPTGESAAPLSQSYRVLLPEAWITPGLEVTLEIDPDGAVAEADEQNNTRLVTPEVGTATVLHFTAVPVVHGGTTATIPGGFADEIWRIWPVAEIDVQTRAPYTFSGTLSGSNSTAWSQLLQELAAVRKSDGSSRLYYGFVKVGYGSGIAGIGYVGSPVSTGRNDSLGTLVHELGHNFGRPHAPCGTSGDANFPYPNARLGTWGFDLQTQQLVSPTQSYDLMSYCDPSWVSDYNYEQVQVALESKASSSSSSWVSEGDVALMLVAGRLAGGELVELRPVQRLSGPAPSITEGPHTLRLETAGGVVEMPFGVTQVDEVDEQHFTLLVPDPGVLQALEIRQGARVLTRRVAPAVPPPAAAELVEEGGVLRVRWDASTAPTARVAHVGRTRTTLGLWLTGGEAALRVEELEHHGEFEVSLSDGLNSTVFRVAR